MTRRYFSTTAVDSSLSAAVDQTVTTIPVAAPLSGWPSAYPFTAAIDPGTVSEEIVTVTGLAGSTSLTVVRGVDGSAATSHLTAAVLSHVTSARDFDEPNAHIQATANVHGLTGGDTVASGNALSALTTTVSGQTSSISSTNATVATNTANIATNTANIATNTSNISTNTSGVATAKANAATAQSAANTANTGLASRVQAYGNIPAVTHSPGPSSGFQMLTMAASVTPTLSGVNGTIYFPSSFPSGVVTVVAMVGDSAGVPGTAGPLQINNSTVTTSGFSFSIPGASSGSTVRVNYVAYGW